MLEYDNWVRMQDHWRSGQVLWIRTHQHAGYVFNYGFDPTRVSEWIGHGDHLNVTPLPANMRVLYKHVPTADDAEYLKAYTVEQVERIDMDARGIYFAAEWFGDYLENIAGDTPEPQTPPEQEEEEEEVEEERPSTDSWEQRESTSDTPAPPFDENGNMLPHV